MVRAARTGSGRRGPGELIQEPSRGGVLSAFGASAIVGGGDLRLTLAGLVQEGRGPDVTVSGPAAVWPRPGLLARLPAELFTGAGGAPWGARFPRPRITPETVSVQDALPIGWGEGGRRPGEGYCVSL